MSISAYEEWIDLAVSTDLAGPLPVPGDIAWITSGGTIHSDYGCPKLGTVHVIRQHTIEPVTCPRCSRALRTSRSANDHRRWAVAEAATLFRTRGYTSATRAGLYFRTARYARQSEQTVATLRSLTPDSPAYSQVCRLADVIDQQTLRPSPADREKYQRAIRAAATVWTQTGSVLHSRVRPTALGVLSPGLASDVSIFLGYYVADDVAGFYQQMIDGYAAGADWPDLARRLQWSAGTLADLSCAQLASIGDLPEQLQYRRKDFATTVDWLEAEYRFHLRAKADLLLAATKADLTASTPDDLRMWVTVTVPSRVPKGDVDDPLMYVAWFEQATVKGQTLAQIPLTVLAMLCKITRRSPAAWHPRCSDPLVQSTLDAMLALLADGSSKRLLAAYDTACAVTGLDECQVYGTAHLAVAPVT